MKTRNISLLLLLAVGPIAAEAQTYPIPATPDTTNYAGFMTHDPGVTRYHEPTICHDCGCRNWPLPGCCCDKDSCCPRKWQITADYFLYSRDAAAPQTVILDNTATIPVYDISDLDFRFESGTRLSFLHHSYPCVDFELGYLGLFDVTESQYLSDGAGLTYSFFGVGPAAPNTSYHAQYIADLHSIDFNAIHRKWDWLSLIYGFRWANLDEKYNILLVEDPPSGAMSRSDNALYGFQFGGSSSVWLGRWMRLDSSLKAGVYYNHVSITASAEDPGGGGTLSLGQSHCNTAFMGEASLVGTIPIKDCASLRVGYQLIYLDGVALAPNQGDDFDLSTGNGSADWSHILYHGLNVGLEIVY